VLYSLYCLTGSSTPNGYASHKKNSMKLKEKEKRFSAILALQKKQKKQRQGSYLYEVYDKAIDLALNPQREVNDFFTQNLCRDAKRILKRRSDSAPHLVSLSTVQADHDDVYIKEDIAIESYTALDELVFHDLQAQLNLQCSKIHSLAPQILQGIIFDIPGTELAQTLNVSESLVKKIRISLKKVISNIIMN